MVCLANYALYIVVIVIRSAKFLGALRNGIDLLLYVSRLWPNQILVAGDGNYFDKWRCSLKPHLYNNGHFRFPLARGIPTFGRAQQATGLTRTVRRIFYEPAPQYRNSNNGPFKLEIATTDRNQNENNIYIDLSIVATATFARGLHPTKPKETTI